MKALNSVTSSSRGKIHAETLSKIKDIANGKIAEILVYFGVSLDEIQNDGYEIRCSCPIHEGDNPTAFAYNTKYKNWKCYSNSCHENHVNNIFGLVQSLLIKKNNKNASFVEAVYWLTNFLEINLDVLVDSSFKVDKNDVIVQRLINEVKTGEAIKWRSCKSNEEKLKPIPVDSIKDKIIPSKFFLKEGFTEDTLKKFLVSECYDKLKPMYYRAFAPVLDEQGQVVVGVTGRTLYDKCHRCGEFHRNGTNCPRDDKSVQTIPKWKHYGFNSSEVVYNLWNAKEHIIKSRSIVIAEGPKDVWKLDEAGIVNSICLLGTKISTYHIAKLVEMNVLKVILALDNDPAGVSASDNIYDTLDKYFRIINVTRRLPDGSDIADLDNKTIKEIINE